MHRCLLSIFRVQETALSCPEAQSGTGIFACRPLWEVNSIPEQRHLFARWSWPRGGSNSLICLTYSSRVISALIPHHKHASRPQAVLIFNRTRSLCSMGSFLTPSVSAATIRASHSWYIISLIAGGMSSAVLQLHTLDSV